jgi:hypothetical protein
MFHRVVFRLKEEEDFLLVALASPFLSLSPSPTLAPERYLDLSESTSTYPLHDAPLPTPYDLLRCRVRAQLTPFRPSRLPPSFSRPRSLPFI